MKWLSLSSKLSRPRSNVKMNAAVKRRKKKNSAPAGSRPGGGRRAGSVILFILFLAALGGGGWWLMRSSKMFIVREIRIRNNHAYTEQEIMEMTGLETGGNIFSLDPAAARDNLLHNSDFRDARVERIFPDLVQVDVVEREPRARVHFGQLYTIDDRGVVLGPRKSAPEARLPIIRGLKVVNNSRDLSPPDKKDACLRLLRELEEQGIGSLVRIDEIRIFSSDLIEMKTEGEMEITLGQEDYGEQLMRLKTVLNKLGSDLDRAREVDLRYSRIPVVFDD
ncbi:MAG: FtsQ-type POTRA domain-containing protein [PVC group bacterium]